jgi:hypothetical protein
MNLKLCERKFWPNLKYYPRICPEELRNITKKNLVRMDGVLVGIRTGLVPNTREKVYHLSHLDQCYGSLSEDRVENGGWRER